jgi:Family of unknown function (DUF6159)
MIYLGVIACGAVLIGFTSCVLHSAFLTIVIEIVMICAVALTALVNVTFNGIYAAALYRYASGWGGTVGFEAIRSNRRSNPRTEPRPRVVFSHSTSAGRTRRAGVSGVARVSRRAGVTRRASIARGTGVTRRSGVARGARVAGITGVAGVTRGAGVTRCTGVAGVAGVTRITRRTGIAGIAGIARVACGTCRSGRARARAGDEGEHHQ